ncbi:MAG: N-acetylmuramoyl-L-alanine amidase CwlD [Cellulosilyticaceae bacterium]
MKKHSNNMMVVLFICLIGFCTYLKFANTSAETFGLATASKVIVIDPGHGGHDPGKVGSKGVHEDEINLQIAMKLKNYLEQSGATVIMTRTDDSYLEGPGGNTHKRKDMSHRKQVMEVSEADVLISIHQNAFTQPQVRGAQVFYYKDSEEAKLLATNVQKAIQDFADSNNTRKIKSSKDYYVLKVSEMPGIIIECGFLTNEEEEALLVSEAYQDKVAWAIYRGIVSFFEQTEDIKAQ